jgi:DNA repair protein RadC
MHNTNQMSFEFFTRAVVPVYEICLKRTGYVDTDHPYVCSPGIAETVIQRYLADVDREHFVVLLLDTKNKMIGMNTVAIGGLDRCTILIREVFKAAIALNAASIIIAHNHPSGEVHPSGEDKRLTDVVRRVGQDLSIPVLDHVIVGWGSGKYFSFREAGLIPEEVRERR